MNAVKAAVLAAPCDVFATPGVGSTGGGEGVSCMKNFYGLKLLKNHFYTKKNADPPNLNMIIDNLDFMKTTVNILRPIYHALNKTKL